MRRVTPPPELLNLFDWAERHRFPWQIRRIAARHHLPFHVAAAIAQIMGMGGEHDH